ncbi:ABC transporter substrate-binding protein [Paenibacillus sp. LjRoot153]|uniref:ABC transporter substrate-binding protein n=1 Tax=Paenibacillus sp. LjRoot153 TaxID=3342270 RepID=UPI003ECEC44B
MGKIRKSMVVTLATVLSVGTLLAGCSSSKNEASPSPVSSSGASPAASASAKVDNSKEVKLVTYLLGDAPKGMPEVLKALNEKLKKDINATIDLRYIGWSDVKSKYPLVLASGEDVDMIFAADWNFYVQESTKSAFLPITEDMLKTYMPKHAAKLDPSALKATQVNGKSYMIPTSTPDRKVSVALIRKDIREKAGLAEIKRFSEIGPYMEAVKKNYPEMVPLNLDSQFDLPTPYQYLMQDKVGYAGAPLDSGDPLAQGTAYDYEDKSGKVYSMVEDGPLFTAQKYAANIMKDWYDKGYINKNPYANKIRSKDNFCEGKSGVALGNTIDVASVMTACKAKGIETEVVASVNYQGHAPQNSWLNNGMAIAAGSKNSARALQALDLIMEDPAYVYLTYFGIEGKNYKVTDGKIGLPDGVTSETNTYPADAAGFWFVNKDLFKPMGDWTNSYVTHYNKVKDYLIPVTYGSFSFNPEKVKTELANLANVSTQYANPLYIGAVKSVDDSFNTLTDKMKAAGIDKVKAEVEKQTGEFLSKAK